MKLFFNIFCLFLLSVPCFAQTNYTGSQSTSSSATTFSNTAPVSAQTNLSLNVGQKLAISVHDGTGISNNPLFQGNPILRASNLAIQYDGSYGANGATNQEFVISSAFYTNADNLFIQYDLSNTTFIHQNGITQGSIDIHRSSPTAFWEILAGNFQFTSPNLIPNTHNLFLSNFVLNILTSNRQNLLWFVFNFRLDANSIDTSVDRGGNYFGYATVSAITL